MRNLSSSSSRSKTIQPLKIFSWIWSLHIKSRPSANILNSYKIFLLCDSHLLLGSLLPPLGPMKKAFLHWPLLSSSQPLLSFMLRLRGPFLISPMFRGIMSYTRLIWHKSQNIFGTPSQYPALPWRGRTVARTCPRLWRDTPLARTAPAGPARNTHHPEKWNYFSGQ